MSAIQLAVVFSLESKSGTNPTLLSKQNADPANSCSAVSSVLCG